MIQTRPATARFKLSSAPERKRTKREALAYHILAVLWVGACSEAELLLGLYERLASWPSLATVSVMLDEMKRRGLVSKTTVYQNGKFEMTEMGSAMLAKGVRSIERMMAAPT